MGDANVLELLSSDGWTTLLNVLTTTVHFKLVKVVNAVYLSQFLKNQAEKITRRVNGRRSTNIPLQKYI